MIFEVEMHAFADGKIRRVTIPDHEIEPRPRSGGPAWHRRMLGLAFHYGQNDFCLLDDRGQQLPSVSVGDVVRLDGERYAVLPVGWARIAQDFIPPHDGGMWAYMQAVTDEGKEVKDARPESQR